MVTRGPTLAKINLSSGTAPWTSGAAGTGKTRLSGHFWRAAAPAAPTISEKAGYAGNQLEGPEIYLGLRAAPDVPAGIEDAGHMRWSPRAKGGRVCRSSAVF
jgi:hypothetical protein